MTHDKSSANTASRATAIGAGLLMLLLPLPPASAFHIDCTYNAGGPGSFSGFLERGEDYCISFFVDTEGIPTNGIIIASLRHEGGPATLAGEVLTPGGDVINGMQYFRGPNAGLLDLGLTRETRACTAIETGEYTFRFGAFNVDGGAAFHATVDTTGHILNGNGPYHPVLDQDPANAALWAVIFVLNFGVCQTF